MYVEPLWQPPGPGMENIVDIRQQNACRPGMAEGFVIVVLSLLFMIATMNALHLLGADKYLAHAIPFVAKGAPQILLTITEVFVFAMVLFYLFGIKKYPHKSIGLTTDSAFLNTLRGIGYSVAATIAGFIITVAVMIVVFAILNLAGWTQPEITSLFNRLSAAENETAKLTKSWFGFALALIAAPFLEELLFRGILFKSLRGTLSFWPAALISSAFFTALHFYIIGSLMVFVLGFVSAFAMERHKSIVPCIVMHILWNLRVVLIMAFQ